MAEPWVAQPTTTCPKAQPPATTSARDLARQSKLDRNTRVDSWRNIVAASATECTCAPSPAPSTAVDSAASSSRTTSTTTHPEADASRSRALTPASTTTTSHEHRQQQLQYDGAHVAPPFCSVCARLGAPMFMGQCEFEEEDVEIPPPKRAMFITKTLRNFTRRLTLNPNRVIQDIRKSSNGPVTPAVAKDPPAKQPDAPSRDSFVESRRNKILRMHRDRRQQQQARSDVQQDDSNAAVKNRVSIDLNRVNEALMMPSPPLKRPNTRGDQFPAPADSASPPHSPDTAPKPQKSRAADQSGHHITAYSSSSATSASIDGVTSFLKRHRLRTRAQGVERLERAQQLLNRDKTESPPAKNAPLVPA